MKLLLILLIVSTTISGCTNNKYEYKTKYTYKYCEGCGADISGSDVTGVYCSTECFLKHATDKEIEEYKKKQIKEKREAEERAKHAYCVDCGKYDLKTNMLDASNGLELNYRCKSCQYNIYDNPIIGKCDICSKVLRKNDVYYYDNDDFDIKCNECHNN